jgi:acyl carrier protein
MAGTLEIMRQVITERFGIDGNLLTADQPIASLGLDSLAFIEYSFELEKELRITLPDLPRDLVTVGDLARFVHGEVGRQAQANANAVK